MSSEDSDAELAEELSSELLKQSIKLSAPKRHLSNERTALKWVSRSLELGGVATFVLSWLGLHGTGLSILLWLAVVGLLLYTIWRFAERAHVLTGSVRGPRTDPFSRLYDAYGPVVLGSALATGGLIIVVLVGLYGPSSGPD